MVIDQTYVCLKTTILHNISESWEQLCACVSVLRGERSIGIVLVLLYELLQSKGKGKMQ